MKNCENDINKNFQRIWDSDYENIFEREVDESWQKFSARIRTKETKKYRNQFIRQGAVVALFLVLSAGFLSKTLSPTITVRNLSMPEKKVTFRMAVQFL